MSIAPSVGSVLLVAAGSATGGVARYALSAIVQRAAGPNFPYGTLTVNVLGCLAIGALMAGVETRSPLPAAHLLFFGVGVLGSFTTFSTFGYDTLALFRQGQGLTFVANVIANVVLGLLAVALGRLIALNW